MRAYIAAATLMLGISTAYAAPYDQQIAMRATNASTFYVDAELGGFGKVDLMVDTGASYTSINETTLKTLKKNGSAVYIRDLVGTLANGSKVVVPIYRISSINIGGECHLSNIEVAVFPGKTRHILGISTLKKAAPFVFSMDPPGLLLSNCVKSTTVAAKAASSQPQLQTVQKEIIPPPASFGAVN